MPLHKICRFLSPIGFGGALVAAVVLGGSRPALASPGCDGVNSNFILQSVTGGGSSASALVSNFAAGDVVTVTVVRAVAGAGTFRIVDANGANVYVDVNKGASTTVSYVVRGTTDTTLTTFIVSTGPQISISATCRTGVLASTAARAMQLQLTPVVALASGAAITGAVDGAIADAFAGSAAPFTGGPGFVRVNLASEQNRVPEAFDALGYVDRGRRAPAAERPWSAWIDARGTQWSEDNSVARVRSSQINVTAGIGHKLTPDVVVGLFMGYENFDYEVQTFDGTLKGSGWTTGAYAAWRIARHLRLDATVAWSNVNYDVSAVTAAGAINGASAGAFDGGRGLGSVGITGIYPSSGFVFEPSVRAFALWERQKSWTDNTGQEQAARTFTIGRVSTGAKLSYPLPGTQNLAVTPYAGVYGDYRFSKDDALPVAVGTFGIADGLSGRVISGVALTNRQGATFTVGGELGGLGLADQRLWALNARGVLPF